MTRRLAVLGLICMLAAVIAGAAQSFASRGDCGPGLCLSTPPGWSNSVGLGVVNSRKAAWLLLGDFWFPPDAAGHEGGPSVPAGKILISIGDFPVVAAFAHWRHVRRLRLPQRSTTKRAVSWHVRFAGRAVFLSVNFGSTPSPRARRLASARLLAIHRNQH